MSEYGYGDGAPDSDKYGYGYAAPDADNHAYDYSEHDREKYGYGNGAPDDSLRRWSSSNGSQQSRRGSGESDQRSQENKDDCAPQATRRKMGRRSSMKQEGAPRRSSITVRSEVTVQLPGRSTTVRRRQSIGFSEYDEVKEVAPVKDLADNPELLWFQDHEYGQIREKAILLTDLAASGDFNLGVNKKFCTRGLESHIDRATVDKELNMAWRSVFMEQYHQRLDGDFDDETVAKLYEMASISSRARALQRAEADSQDAEKHTRGIRNSLRRLSLV